MQSRLKGSFTNEKKNAFELPEDRLATTSKQGDRVYLYPASVKGLLRTYRTYIYWILIFIFLGLPWVKIGNNPLILLDIVHRKFILFGFTFWAHEAPILVLVLLTFVLSTGLVTALLGRVWCGWACPQTVFIDGVFRRIEEFLEGSGLSRKRFDEQPMTAKKMTIKGIKWGLFFLASMIITHSFLAYFVGSDQVLEMIQHPPTENFTSFMTIVISLLVILFDFGWFREQFCVIACPYGRLQSVLMDEHSLVVAYDEKRGEPRQKDRHDVSSTGDCINCYRCVQVCPTGIDIRRGTQMECIMCTACIDACNQVMKKVGRKPGLIRHDSEQALKGGKISYLRPRVLVYLGLLTIVVSLFIFFISNRNMVPTFVKRASTPPYSEVSSQTVQNQFNISVRNQFFEPIDISFTLDEAGSYTDIQIIEPFEVLTLSSGEKRDYVIFIRFPKNRLVDGKYSLKLIKTIKKQDETVEKFEEVILVGPK